VSENRETLTFQAEVQRLLHLMIHSLYSNKEVFLRELVSNASDACDKLRFAALQRDGLLADDPELRIRIDVDRAQRTISVTDNGIGMSRAEVIEHLGTIARSGTREFIEGLTGDGAKDLSLIGQFGVGFYSAFVVADKVTVLTRRAGAPAAEGVRWESQGEGAYTVETLERPARGTEVILHLREGEDDLLDPQRMRTLIRKYSDHIALPVQMLRSEGPGSAAREYETVNRASAFWRRPKQEIADAEYREFYKHVAHDFEDPLAWTHHRVEGRLEWTALLYIPARAGFDLYDRTQQRGVKLYVQRVFIMDDAEQLLPRYLRFVRGVIDSNDLPLNVSREMLQDNQVVESLRAGATKRVLTLLEELRAQDRERYQTFWDQFGRVLKEGCAEDPAHAETLAGLMQFASTHSGTAQQNVGFADYVERMQTGQAAIYYLTADSYATAAASPHLEVFRDKGIEVLLLSDHVDEWVVAAVPTFADKPLRSVSRGDLDLDTVARADSGEAALEQEFREMLARVRSLLGDRVEDVRLSRRLKDSPSCLVVPEGALGARLERWLRELGQDAPMSKPILELNPTHPIVIKARHEEDKERFRLWSELLFDQAVLAEGGDLRDPAAFVRRMNELLIAVAR
jgi:molecular chaperone HtpG